MLIPLYCRIVLYGARPPDHSRTPQAGRTFQAVLPAKRCLKRPAAMFVGDKLHNSGLFAGRTASGKSLFGCSESVGTLAPWQEQPKMPE